jgi:hypothetical protein
MSVHEPKKGRYPGQTRPSVPVVPQIPVRIEPGEDARLEGVAARLKADEPALDATDAFGPRVGSGMTDGPMLLIGDHSEIALTSASDVSVLEYRILLLAGGGDLVAVGGDRNAPFEDYCRDILGLGDVEVLAVPRSQAPNGIAIARRCHECVDVFERLTRAAREAGSLTIMPHIGTGNVWNLAASVAEASGAEVRVAAPPPRLTRRVNDKLWFAEQAAAVLGKQSLPPIASVFGPAALAGQVAALARRNDRVAIKVPDSAGSAGNIMLTSQDLLDKTLTALRHHLIDLLMALGWRGRFPLLVQVWDCPLVSSPSVQVWVPPREAGPPIVEGVFEQTVEGAKGEFVGAIPATLPEDWLYRLAGEAVRMARVYQALGYFGPCSFDAVIAGTDLANASLHWIECNGRWGGVSVPMTLANRLTGDWQDRPFVVIQRTNLKGRPQSFATALEQIDELLYRPGKAQEGVIILTPGGIERGSAVHLMALADTVAAARQKAMAATKALALGAGGLAA